MYKSACGFAWFPKITTLYCLQVEMRRIIKKKIKKNHKKKSKGE